MKQNALSTGLLICVCSLSSMAQVMESSKVMSKGANSSLSIEIPDIPASYAEDVYKDFIKTYKGKIKKDKKSNEWFSDDAKVSSIANGAPIDIYSKIEGSGTKSVLNMWVNIGGGYINSTAYPSEYQEAKNILEKFKQTVLVRKAEDELAEEEKNLKKLDNDLKKLVKDNEDYQKEIEKCNQKIREAEQSIVKNEEDQKNKQLAISEQNDKVESAKTKVNKIKQ